MTRELVFLPAARLEVIDAVEWYQTLAPGLGAAFEDAIDTQISRIIDNPLQFPMLVADIRRARLKRFPYALFFRVLEQEMFVIACLHASRDPNVWQDRI